MLVKTAAVFLNTNCTPQLVWLWQGMICQAAAEPGTCPVGCLSPAAPCHCSFAELMWQWASAAYMLCVPSA